MITTPKNCPGFEQRKHLQSFVCKCPNCGEEKEIFSDEFERQHLCKKCKKPIDFTRCEMTGGV
jgi:hypothetical protein